MNPWGILFVGLGLIMIVIGFKGSQHSVVDAFKGIKPASNVVGTPNATSTGSASSSSADLQAAAPQPTINLQAGASG